jgi:Ni/Co efflux regulator RcnB
VRILPLRPLLALIVPASGDSEDDCGETDGMYIGRGNRSSQRKRDPAPLLSIRKSHMTRPGFEPGPPRWEAGDYPPELWRGHIRD